MKVRKIINVKKNKTKTNGIAYIFRSSKWHIKRCWRSWWRRLICTRQSKFEVCRYRGNIVIFGTLSYNHTLFQVESLPRDKNGYLAHRTWPCKWKGIDRNNLASLLVCSLGIGGWFGMYRKHMYTFCLHASL